LLDRPKQYYYNNREEILKYHALTHHKYIEQRRHDIMYREKQRSYQKYYKNVKKDLQK
jgi:hypothetical protein